MNPAKVFVKNLDAATKNLNLRLESFRETPNVKNVHDIRTSIRRVEAALKLLPKNLQKKSKVTKYLIQAKSLFRATSKIRDIDIIGDTLLKFDPIPKVRDLLARNQKKRARILPNAMGLASALSKITPPHFASTEISRSRLAKRRKKVEKQFEDQLNLLVDKMVSNPTPDQLHKFRKKCKMLRYTLEFNSKDNKRIGKILVEIQRSLGTVTDSYTTIRSVSGSLTGGTARPIIDELNATKDAGYHSFLQVLTRKLKPLLQNKNQMI